MSKQKYTSIPQAHVDNLYKKIAELEKEVSIALGLHSNMSCNIKELEKENRELQEYLKELE
jgi:hypothetical protein